MNQILVFSVFDSNGDLKLVCDFTLKCKQRELHFDTGITSSSFRWKSDSWWNEQLQSYTGSTRFEIEQFFWTHCICMYSWCIKALEGNVHRRNVQEKWFYISMFNVHLHRSFRMPLFVDFAEQVHESALTQSLVRASHSNGLQSQSTYIFSFIDGINSFSSIAWLK